MTDCPSLSALEAQALAAWDDWEAREMGYALYFREIAERSGVPERQVRRVVRALARKGVVTLVRGLFDDEGRTAGSGYGLMPLGRAMLAAREEQRA